VILLSTAFCNGGGKVQLNQIKEEIGSEEMERMILDISFSVSLGK
jgi:hypothetical protein